jgi:hypothetical protein
MRADSERWYSIARLNVSRFRFWCILESLALASSLILSIFNACHRTTSLFWPLRSKPVPNSCKVAGTALCLNQQHASWGVKKGGGGGMRVCVYTDYTSGVENDETKGGGRNQSLVNTRFFRLKCTTGIGWAIKDEGKTVLKLRFTLWRSAVYSKDSVDCVFGHDRRGLGPYLRATLGDEDTVGGVQVFFSVYCCTRQVWSQTCRCAVWYA